jgi:hypothetical protein
MFLRTICFSVIIRTPEVGGDYVFEIEVFSVCNFDIYEFVYM